MKSLEVRFLAPKPLFSGFPRKGSVPLTVCFQNFSTGEGVRYFWDFGDGSTSQDVSPVHTYMSDGVYTVQMSTFTAQKAQGVVTKKGYVTVDAVEKLSYVFVEPTSGPAGTDMITGLYSASADSIPILCITGQAPRARLHKEDFQAVDIESIKTRLMRGQAMPTGSITPSPLGGFNDPEVEKRLPFDIARAKALIAEMENGSPDDDYYDAKVKVLSEEIKHHVKEEEQRGGPHEVHRGA